MGEQHWLTLMREGRFEAAWALADAHGHGVPADEWRRPRHLQRVWNGAPLHGQRVLIRCYHGLGDTLQFVRYVPMVTAIARQVVLWVQPALIPLLAGLPGIDCLLPLHDGDPGVDADVDVEIMELPYVFRTTLATMPARVPYLPPPPLVPPSTRPALGFAWRAGDWNPQRSLPLEQAVALVQDVGWQVEPLQLSLSAEEARHFDARRTGVPLHELAGRMAGLDLVITVDTVFAHLAGALACPTWLLLDADPDWRWMRDRVDSPWYPTMRLFRQPSRGDWTPVVRDVRARLLDWTP